MRLVVTGGAGFIGSAFVRAALHRGWAQEVVVVDALTYAGNFENLAPVETHPGLTFVRCDVADAKALRAAVGEGADALVHFAAESHVDRSIESAAAFVRTNVVGTQVVLDVARAAGIGRVVHVSTDEVYGSLALGTAERFVETTPLQPTSPYAASKAAADHLALAAHRTHGLDVVITRCSNNYGPYQFPEKLIPLFVTNCFEGKPLPLYGDGENVRDWIHVDDHVAGIELALRRGKAGEVYNFGGECERPNHAIARAIVAATGADPALITKVKDRLAHDRRYAIDCAKARRELGFTPGPPIEQRLPEVVAWYREQRPWWQRVKDGEYRTYYERYYRRLGLAVPG